jgi:hypothetical protein
MQTLIAAEKGEEIDVNLSDPPQLHYEVNYIIKAWMNYRKHGRYPRAGSLDDQCPFLIEDFHTMNLYHTRVEHGITSTVKIPTSNEGWESLLEG